MYYNENAHPNVGANVGANMPPNMGPMPTYTAPAYGYGYDGPPYQRNNFTTIVVLFILLVIIGASCFKTEKC